MSRESSLPCIRVIAAIVMQHKNMHRAMLKDKWLAWHTSIVTVCLSLPHSSHIPTSTAAILHLLHQMPSDFPTVPPSTSSPASHYTISHSQLLLFLFFPCEIEDALCLQLFCNLRAAYSLAYFGVSVCLFGLLSNVLTIACLTVR